MTDSAKGKLIILAGPSGVGKTALRRAFSTFYQDLYSRMTPLILFTSRPIRPFESEGVDYFFRSLSEIRNLKQGPRYIVHKVHQDFQAIDKINLHELIKDSDVFYEGNTAIGRLFQTHPDLSAIKKITIFLSPLSRQEILRIRVRGKKNFQDTLLTLMRQKLLRRMKQYGRILNAQEVKDIQQRAIDAYFELKEAYHFDYIIPNHDGEDSDNWDKSFLPAGDAGRALDTLAAILTNHPHPNIEKWEENLVP